MKNQKEWFPDLFCTIWRGCKQKNLFEISQRALFHFIVQLSSCLISLLYLERYFFYIKALTILATFQTLNIPNEQMISWGSEVQGTGCSGNLIIISFTQVHRCFQGQRVHSNWSWSLRGSTSPWVPNLARGFIWVHYAYKSPVTSV